MGLLCLSDLYIIRKIDTIIIILILMENFKVVLVGDTNVGKTSILQRYAKDSFETD